MALRGKYPCPSCGVDLRTPRPTGCRCGWPLPPGTSPGRAEALVAPRPFQYRLRSLLILTTASSVLFAAIGRLGIMRFLDHLEAAVIVSVCLFLAPIGFLWWWRSNGFDDV